MVFEIGKTYRFVMYHSAPSEGTEEFSGTVKAYQAPLLRLVYHGGDEEIINTASGAFISAKANNDELELRISG